MVAEIRHVDRVPKEDAGSGMPVCLVCGWPSDRARSWSCSSLWLVSISDGRGRLLYGRIEVYEA